MDMEESTNDQGYDTKKYTAIIKHLNTGETERLIFHTLIPKEHSSNEERSLEIAKAVLLHVLGGPKKEDREIEIESITQVTSVVEIAVDPICPN